MATESRGMEKSPLLANGYNPPPTHLNPMQFMALNHAAQQAAAAAAQHALLGSPGSTMPQGGLQAGLNLAGANHHGLASHSQASANYAAHHSAAAAAANHGMINRQESDAVSKGSSSVDPMVAARYVIRPATDIILVATTPPTCYHYIPISLNHVNSTKSHNIQTKNKFEICHFQKWILGKLSRCLRRCRQTLGTVRLIDFHFLKALPIQLLGRWER